MEEFLESCRATSLLAELEDDEELPEADEEDEDENEEDCEDNYDEETSESSRSLLRFDHFYVKLALGSGTIHIVFCYPDPQLC
jgi:hypothetical protein